MRFNTEEAQKYLKTKWIGRKIVYKEVTATTMDDAENGAMTQGLPHGTAFLAEVMTNARGSNGRAWNAKEYDNLYLSFIIILDKDCEDSTKRAFDIEVAASLASLQTLHEIGLAEVKVKWFNDLWVRGHKIQGALTEYKGNISVNSEEKDLYILGIGLNVNVDMARNPSMASLATSVMCQLGTKVSRERLFAGIANHLEDNLSLERETLYKMNLDNQLMNPGDEVKLYYINSDKMPSICRLEEMGMDHSVTLSDLTNTEQTWKMEMLTYSIRPHPSRSVYVYRGQSSMRWSSTLMSTTWSYLIDTSQYDLKYLSDEALKEGIPSDCALVILGKLSAQVDQSDLNTLQEYVKTGGRLLATGSTSQVFTSTKAFMPQIKPHTYTICTEEKQDIIVMSGYTDPTLSIPEKSIQKTLAISQSSRKPVVAVCTYGDGKLCLCGVHLEVTYADLEEFFEELLPEKDALQASVFNRDTLLLKAIKELGL